MKWFIVNNATDNKVGNVYPQTAGMCAGYDLNKRYSVWELERGKFPDFVPDLDYFILDKKANLTDVISTGLITSTGFLLNDKTKAILENYSMPLHKYYPARVMYKNTFYENYSWLHFGEDNANLINYQQSSFELKHPIRKNIPSEQLDIKCLNDLITVKNHNSIKAIFPSSLVVDNCQDRDMIFLPILWNKYYFKENIIEAIQQHKVTGLEYYESTLVRCR